MENLQIFTEKTMVFCPICRSQVRLHRLAVSDGKLVRQGLDGMDGAAGEETGGFEESPSQKKNT